MHKQIFYFSGTGNSLYVAKKIQAQLGETELLRITPEICAQTYMVEAETLGLVFPVYAWGPPVIVEKFLKTAALKKPGYLFVVATHGGGPENALKYVAKLFQKRGLTIDSAFDIRMPGNYIVGSNPPAGEAKQQILDATDVQLAEIAEKIAGRAKTGVPAGQFPGTLKTIVIHPFFARIVHSQDKKFWATDKCTGCGVCGKLCAVNNITFNAAKKPEWRHHCEYCLACINWCPVQAIEFGDATAQRNRYHHPDIQASALMRKDGDV